VSRIPETKIEEIQSASDVVSVVSRYVALKKAGKNFKGLCPFHKEKTPSFIVSPEKQIYHCFGCGKGGNVFNFLKSVENISYIEAIRRVASDLGITLPEYRPADQKATDTEYDHFYHANQIAKEYFNSFSTNQAKQYLQSRKLKQGTLDRYGVGYAANKWDGLINFHKYKSINRDIYVELGLVLQKEETGHYFDRFRNRIMFPFYNLSGQIVGFGGRRLNENDQPKYLNSPESKIYKKGDILYGLYQAIPAIREKKTVIIVEGYFDLLRLVDEDIQNVVASSGTALTEGQARLIKRYTDKAIISYDSDDAGIKAAVRNSQVLESQDLHVTMVVMPKPFDPDTFILEKGKAAYVDLVKLKIMPIDFQLTTLQAQSVDLALEEKYRLIDELLEDYLQIPNDVKVGLYIHKIADKMEIAESFLISRFNNLKKRNRYKPPEKDEKDLSKINIVKKGQWRAEEDLISILLLDDKEVARYIFDHISTEDFANDHLREIFEQLVHQWEDMGHFSLKDLEKAISTESGMSLISKLSLQVIEQPSKYAAGCIYKMRKWHLDVRYREIHRLMKEESVSSKSESHYTRELTDIIKRIAEVEKNRQKMFNANF